MPDLGTSQAAIEPIYLTVEDAAALTGRSHDVVRRYIRQGTVDSVQDPDDGRRRLIPDTDLVKILRQPRHGYETRTVTLTTIEGTIKRRIVMKKEG